MRVEPTEDELIALTAEWTGDRFPGGRPRVPDEILRRLTSATAEHAWSILHKHQYEFQYVSGWKETQPGKVIAGRALTAQFLPKRPDHYQAVVTAGAAEGHMEGDNQNSWVIQSLVEGDVMVVDIFGKVVEGTVIGDNLGSALAAATKTGGAVIDGGVRDLSGLVELTNVNVYFRQNDPTPIRNVTLSGMNIPVRIGGTTVLPGDVILGTADGVTAIPPQFAEEICDAAEEIAHRDTFGKLRLTEGTYTSAQIDGKWAEHIEADYLTWSESNPRR